MAKRPREVTARQHAVLSGEPGEDLVTAGIGPTGDAIALWARPEDHMALNGVSRTPEGVQFPSTRAPRPVHARVVRYSSRTARRTAETRIRTQLAHIEIQPLPGGRSLLVGARARWRPDGPDLNAVVHDRAGRIETETTFGDGISHVQTTPSGRVWVGYFDEGVFGNFGWGTGDGPRPVGRSGLVRFSLPPGDGHAPEWRFPASESPGPIADCYALNVDGETAWAYYYDDFPVVRVRDDAVDGWLNEEVAGATAVAVDGERVALFGGYPPRRDRLTVGRLDGGRLRVEGRFRLVLPGGRRVTGADLVVGRGPVFHLIRGRQWFRLGLEDIV